MPFKAPDHLPADRLQETCDRLANALGAQSIRDFRKEAGSACLRQFFVQS